MHVESRAISVRKKLDWVRRHHPDEYQKRAAIKDFIDTCIEQDDHPYTSQGDAHAFAVQKNGIHITGTKLSGIFMYTGTIHGQMPDGSKVSLCVIEDKRTMTNSIRYGLTPPNQEFSAWSNDHPGRKFTQMARKAWGIKI